MTWDATVTERNAHDASAAPGADDHRRGRVGADLVALSDRLAVAGKGTRSGRDQQVLRAILVDAQGGACAWCDEALDVTTHDGRWKVEVDRIATGRERGFCTCARNCRCGYRAGATVAAHRICQRPEAGEGMPLRYRLPAAEVRARAERWGAAGRRAWDAAKRKTGR